MRSYLFYLLLLACSKTEFYSGSSGTAQNQRTEKNAGDAINNGEAATGNPAEADPGESASPSTSEGTPSQNEESLTTEGSSPTSIPGNSGGGGPLSLVEGLQLTLTIQNASESVVANIDETKSFTADRNSSVNISWTSKYADSCAISQLGQNSLSGNQNLTVIADVALEMECSGKEKTGKAIINLVSRIVNTSNSLLFFGGMYSAPYTNPQSCSAAVCPQTSPGYPNPATDGYSCPTGYTARQFRSKPGFNGTYGYVTADAPAYYCYKTAVPGESPVFDFGGMYGGYARHYYTWDNYVNPITNASSCPSGFSAATIAGWSEQDVGLTYCYRNHVANAANEVSFGGIISFGFSSSNKLNPVTNALSCPTNYSSSFVHGGQPDASWGSDLGLDAYVKICHK